MQEPQLYEYAVIRLVPRVEREEFLNVGVVLYIASRKVLSVKFHLDARRLEAFSNTVNIAEIHQYLESFERICKGGEGSGPIGALPLAQRFRWLTATRSTVVQLSKVHTGFCSDPEKTLSLLYAQFVS